MTDRLPHEYAQRGFSLVCRHCGAVHGGMPARGECPVRLRAALDVTEAALAALVAEGIALPQKGLKSAG